MRLLILVLAFAAMAVFFWQNRQPLPLVFFGGSLKAQLPLAAWVLLFAAAGALSSLIVRGLNASGRKPTGVRDLPAPPASPRPRTPPKPPLTPEPARATVPPPAPAAASDWQASLPPESEEWDDWTNETPPPAPVTEKPPALGNVTPQLRNFEAPQQPESASREGSVYSYRYREPRERPQETPDSQKRDTPKTGEIVDANYRVIAPPYRQPPSEAEDEEEWV